MGYAILIALLVTAPIAVYFLYEPFSAALQRNIFRQKEHVKTELEEMWIFISVDGLQRIKWLFASAMAGCALLLAWDAKPPGPIVAGMAVGVVSYWGPEIFILLLRKRRRAKFSEQLVDGLVLMSNGVRSGFTLQQAIDMLVEEMPVPISQEFELVRRELRLEPDIDKALRKLVERTRDDDLDLAVTAIQITRQMGGNIAEVFDRIVTMVRDRKVLAGKADALTAEGKMQAAVVGLLPYVFGFFMIKVNPEMMKLMWTTIPGLIALALVIVLDLLGYFWVRKAAAIEY